ncbi:hypothetical protein [Streptomyces sp. 351MFTsu5.1]|uniref:hypothetical protein n=1 Tax=Streptomyces sp. 351MFTsu5.1 TaxID=1172180 RepID=UPI00036009A4|nr:hypothetical protein [Streptomyces sp. 351MFTsu5.1]
MPRYTAEQRAAIAAEYDGYANGLERVAADLDSQGHDIAADIQRGTAASLREVADAARESSAALNRTGY